MLPNSRLKLFQVSKTCETIYSARKQIVVEGAVVRIHPLISISTEAADDYLMRQRSSYSTLRVVRVMLISFC